MTNGADAKRRTDRAGAFDDAQRIWLLEQDMDQLVERIDRRLSRIEQRQWWVLATFVGMIITFASVLLSIIGTR